MGMMVEVGMGRRQLEVMEGSTSVECEKNVGCWNVMKSLMEVFMPTCFAPPSTLNDDVLSLEGSSTSTTSSSLSSSSSSSSTSGSGRRKKSWKVKGIIYGTRNGKVRLCLQEEEQHKAPLVVIEMGMKTSTLAREMQNGVLRIAMECQGIHNNGEGELLKEGVWKMYCNGRMVGYAKRRSPCEKDCAVLKALSSVQVGAGVVSIKTRKEKENSHQEDVHATVGNDDEEVMYMKAKYNSVWGSKDSQAFHLINPDGSTRQELSIFFLRSSS